MNETLDLTLQVQRMEDISVIKQLIGEIKDSIIGIEKKTIMQQTMDLWQDVETIDTRLVELKTTVSELGAEKLNTKISYTIS